LGAEAIRAVDRLKSNHGALSMKYAVLAYESPSAFNNRSGEDKAAYWGAWRAYAETLRNAGVMAGGSGLEPPSTATTVRLRKGERTVQDGPFADTKEQLGGFIIIDVPDLDTALEWAARCPAAADGTVEVRPALTDCQNAPHSADAAQPALAN
jgi:hypothetical protein